MSLAAKLRRAPGRIVTGAFILNSGLGKLKGNEQMAGALHGMAKGTYPFLAKVPPTTFLKALSAGELAVGSVLLFPLVPAGLAGLALTGFAASMLGLYIRTPGMHDSRFRPTQAGNQIAKDVWMAGIGIGLIIDAALSESPITKTEL